MWWEFEPEFFGFGTNNFRGDLLADEKQVSISFWIKYEQSLL